MKVVLLFSGGLDSTVLLYSLIEQGAEIVCLGFDYGPRHLRELNAAMEITRATKTEFLTMKLGGLQGGVVGDFHDPVREPLIGAATVVPGRNLLFLTVAASLALKRGYDSVGIAAHGGDAAVYPDCRDEFLAAVERCFASGYGGPKILRPFIGMTKTAIVHLAERLHVPWTKTWSCYRGLTEPCGECGACIERAKALGTHKNQGMTFARLRA